uniref:Wnt family member 3 n=1 Tax=Homo sapiens TaxID=9606 RepID=A0A9L9PXK4_HUMAN
MNKHNNEAGRTFLDSTPPGMSRPGSMATPWDQVPPTTHPVHLGTRCRAVKSWEPGFEFSLHSLTMLV